MQPSCRIDTEKRPSVQESGCGWIVDCGEATPFLLFYSTWIVVLNGRFADESPIIRRTGSDSTRNA